MVLNVTLNSGTEGASCLLKNHPISQVDCHVNEWRQGVAFGLNFPGILLNSQPR
jgi:hypothetical protein